MRLLRSTVLVVSTLLVLGGCPAQDGAGIFAGCIDDSVEISDGNGSVTVSEIESSGVTFSRAPSPFEDRTFFPVGPGFQASPSGRSFSKPVTVRIPIDAGMLANMKGQPEDVRIYSTNEEGRFVALETRLTSTRDFVEASVLHFSPFQAGLPRIDGYCDLSDAVATEAIEETARTALSTLAVSACALLRGGDISAARRSVQKFSASLSSAAGVGHLDSATYHRLSGIVNEWNQPTSAESMLVGTWIGELPVKVSSRVHMFQIQQRQDGRLVGYVFGGAQDRVIPAGMVFGDSASLVFEMGGRGEVRSFVLTGAVESNSFRGNVRVKAWNAETGVQLGESESPFSMQRVPATDVATMTEKVHLLGFPTGGVEHSVNIFASAILVLDASGNLVVGGWGRVPDDHCDTSSGFGCGGEIKMCPAPDNSGAYLPPTTCLDFLSAGLSGIASCKVALNGAAVATYTCSWTNDGVTPLSSSGNLLIEPIRQTQGAVVAQVLRAYASLADDLESNASAAERFLVIDPNYLHALRTRNDFIAEASAEQSLYPQRTVDFSRFQHLFQMESSVSMMPTTFFPMVDFHDRRRGWNGSEWETPYRDHDTVPAYPFIRSAEDVEQYNNFRRRDELRYISVMPDGRVSIVGNQVPVLSLPFAGYDSDDVEEEGAWSKAIHLELGIGGAGPFGNPTLTHDGGPHFGFDYGFRWFGEYDALRFKIVAPASGVLRDVATSENTNGTLSRHLRIQVGAYFVEFTVDQESHTKWSHDLATWVSENTHPGAAYPLLGLPIAAGTVLGTPSAVNFGGDRICQTDHDCAPSDDPARNACGRGDCHCDLMSGRCANGRMFHFGLQTEDLFAAAENEPTFRNQAFICPFEYFGALNSEPRVASAFLFRNSQTAMGMTIPFVCNPPMPEKVKEGGAPLRVVWRRVEDAANAGSSYSPSLIRAIRRSMSTPDEYQFLDPGMTVLEYGVIELASFLRTGFDLPHRVIFTEAAASNGECRDGWMMVVPDLGGHDSVLKLRLGPCGVLDGSTPPPTDLNGFDTYLPEIDWIFGSQS